MGLVPLAKAAARRFLFGPRKSKRMTYAERKRRTTARLRDELAADKLRNVQVEIALRRAVEEALR